MGCRGGEWCRLLRSSAGPSRVLGAGAVLVAGAVRGGAGRCGAALPAHIRRPGTAPLLRAGPGGAGPSGAQRAAAAGPQRPSPSPSRRSRCRHRAPSSGAGTRPPAPPGAAPGRRRRQSRPGPAPRDRGEVFFCCWARVILIIFFPSFPRKTLSTLMNFRVSTFLKGPPGSDLAAGLCRSLRASPGRGDAAQPRGGPRAPGRHLCDPR